jgi:hypothetical protein
MLSEALSFQEKEHLSTRYSEFNNFSYIFLEKKLLAVSILKTQITGNSDVKCALPMSFFRA